VVVVTRWCSVIGLRTESCGLGSGCRLASESVSRRLGGTGWLGGLIAEGVGFGFGRVECC
jgi:hypothetical protein